MNSILLVDDERLELETLRDYIDWKSMGINPVHAVRNGKQALEYFEEHEPDIVITDIQMPVMDGITLAKEIRKRNERTKIVFLTGYDDFEYVKVAFQVDAVDYVLKPFSVSSIDEVIAKIRGQLEQEKLVEDAMEMTAKQLIERICSSSSLREDLIDQLEKVIGKPKDSIRYGMFAVYGRIEESIIYNILDQFSELQHAILIEDITVFLVLDYVNFKDTAKRIQDSLEDYHKVKYTVVFSEKAVSIKDLRERYNTFILLRTPAFYLIPGDRKEIHELQSQIIILDWEREEKDQNQFLNLLRKEVMIGNQEKARQLTWNYLNHFIGVEKASLLSVIDRLFGLLVNQVVAEDSQLYQHMREEEKVWRNGMREVKSFHNLFESLWQYILAVVEWFIQIRQNPNHHIVTYVKEYIDRNYHIEINVEYMAEGIHLSPNYLRSIFKESTGKTIGEYIKEYRFTKACELLKDKARKVKDISKLVGYEDVSYFCASFTKRFGESPNEYRKLI